MARFVGTAGGDDLLGTDQADVFSLGQGGVDIASGGEGADVFHLADALTAEDRLIGGAGRDTVTLQGDYDLTLDADTLQSIEVLKLGAGGTYHVVLADETIADGHDFKVQAEAPTFLDASANLDGRLFFKGEGQDTVIGGAGNDVVRLHNSFGADDRIDGGDGVDLVFLEGGGGSLEITPDRIVGVEGILLVSGDLHWTLADGVANSYGFSIHSSGGVVDLDARADQDAPLEVYGSFQDDRFLGGGGSDEFSGGPGDDTVRGGEGRDYLSGGADGDLFQYVSIKESRPGNGDIIDGLEYHDRIDLSRIDADRTQDGDQAFRMVGAFDGQAGELTLAYVASDGLTYLSADVNGDGAADMVIQLLGAHADFTGIIL